MAARPQREERDRGKGICSFFKFLFKLSLTPWQTRARPKAAGDSDPARRAAGPSLRPAAQWPQPAGRLTDCEPACSGRRRLRLPVSRARRRLGLAHHPGPGPDAAVAISPGCPAGP